MKRVVAGVGIVVVVVLLGFGVRRCASEREREPASAAADRRTGAPHAGAAGAGGGEARTAPAWFAVRGAPARRIAGRVTLKGAPVADAVVALHSMLSQANAAPIVEVRTGTDGTFDLGLRPPALYDVTAAADHTTAAIVHVDLSDPSLRPPPDQLELRLRACTVFVEGTVFDAAGNPLPKVQVERANLVGTTTDARGAYKLCVPFGEGEVSYSADGYGAVTLMIDARGEMRRDVVLVPEAAIGVRVVRDGDGEAVPDAHVYVVPKQWSPDHPRMTTGITGPDGRVRIAGLVPARYRVTGFADGLQAQAPEEVLAEVGREAEVVLRVDATAQITGKVVAAGKPVAGAKVAAIRKSPSTRSPPAISQPDGSFVLERVPAGDLVFVATPYEVTSPAQFETRAGKRYDDVVIDVHALGKIHGRVTRLGKPVENVEVCCVRTPDNMQPMVRTDADGHYEFAGVPAGTYQVGAGSDEVGAFTLGVEVALAAGEDRVVDHELDQAGTIAGVVVDRDGKPVRGVFVRWVNEKTNDVGRSITDAQGRYRCGAMTGGGRYRAAVFPSPELQQVPYPTADGAPYPILEVEDGQTVIENVKLAIDRPDLAIRGQVIDDAGAPVPDAVVKALPSAGGPPQFHSWLRLPTTSTDEQGRFVLADLAPGTYALSARAVSGAEGIAPSIAAGAKDAVVRVERAGGIEGKLAGFTQPPVVYARPLGAFNLISGVVEGATFRVTALRPGKYIVNAQNTYEGDAQLVEIRAGETAKLTLTSHGRGRIEGSVLDFRTRAPIANATCHAVMAVDGDATVTNWDPSASPKSDAAGRVVLDPAPAGTVDVSCEMVSFRWSRPSAIVTLAAGATAKVELLSVELAQENPSTIGVQFDFRTTPPRIAVVVPGSPAAQAGMLPGDLVTDVDDVAVKGLNGMGVQRLINSTPIGGEVRVRVLRAATAKTFTVKSVAD